MPAGIGNALPSELPELAELLIDEDLDISITGFEPVEIDQIAIDFEEDTSDPADTVESEWLAAPVVSKPGDIWELGEHRLLCGDARNAGHIDRLMLGKRAAMAFLDPPYNVRIKSVVGRGRIKHAEFAMASGEMSPSEFTAFLEETLGNAASVSRDGAVHFVCMDWRHIGELIEAGREVYGEMLNLVVWEKTNAGQGSFYRSAHELIGVFRVGDAKHLNNIELGRHGRSRSNVWHYAGVNTFRAGRMDELAAHPTVKPVAMVADALEGLHPARRYRARHLRGCRHDDPRGRTRRATRLFARARAEIRGCGDPSLAGLHPARCGSRRHGSDLRRRRWSAQGRAAGTIGDESRACTGEGRIMKRKPSRRAAEDAPYEIGYGKPPKHTRFKPGQSGHPSGRPRGQRNFRTAVREALKEKITIREGDRTRTVSKMDAIIQVTFNNALKGDAERLSLPFSSWSDGRA